MHDIYRGSMSFKRFLKAVSSDECNDTLGIRHGYRHRGERRLKKGTVGKEGCGPRCGSTLTQQS